MHWSHVSWILGGWGIEEKDEARIAQEDADFKTQLKAISKQFSYTHKTFTDSLGEFLVALTSVSVKFIRLFKPECSRH